MGGCATIKKVAMALEPVQPFLSKIGNLGEVFAVGHHGRDRQEYQRMQCIVLCTVDAWVLKVLEVREKGHVRRFAARTNA